MTSVNSKKNIFLIFTGEGRMATNSINANYFSLNRYVFLIKSKNKQCGENVAVNINSGLE